MGIHSTYASGVNCDLRCNDTYYGVQFVIDVDIALCTCPRIISVSVVTVDVLFLALILERAVSVLSAKSPRVVFTALVYSAFLATSAIVYESAARI